MSTVDSKKAAKTVRAFAALGSNLGDRHANITSAVDALGRTPGVRVVAVSRIIETEPVGPPGQGPYLNAAVELQTERSPRELLDAFLAIEAAHGRNREREQRWGPRQLDIDLLLYGDQVIDLPGLHVPHPRMAERAFVLRPLAEIAPDLLHPQLGISIQCLLDQLARPSPSE